MRIFAAGLQTETNTFAPWPTGLADFRLRRDSSELENGDLNGAVARLFRDSARADGHEFIEGLFGFVITSVRSQVFSPQAFTGLGIDLEGKRFIVVKSSQHFYNGFAPLADRIVHVATPGALQMNFAEIAYRHRRDLNFFPRVASPFEI
jgi:microcystin degradation protein MlrC